MDNNNTEATPKKRRFNSRYVRIGFTLFIVIALCIVFYFSLFESHTLFGFLKSIWVNLVPFIVGGVLAYLLKPLCVLIEKPVSRCFRKMNNQIKAQKYIQTISIILTAILFLLLLYIMIASVIPQAVESVKGIINNLPDTFDSIISWVRGLAKNNTELVDKIDDFSENMTGYINDWVTKVLNTNSDGVWSTLSTGVKGVVSALKNVLFGSISCVYILGQRKKLAAQGKMIIYSIFSEKWADKVMQEINYCDKMFGGFINGKIIDSIIIGIITFIVLSIFRMPYTVLISVIVGVTNVIPFFGPYIGAIPSALLIFMVSPIKCLYFIIIILVIQQFDGNILGPKILGNTTGLSSFWVLFSIIFFGGMFGFVGMLIGVPLFAVLYDIVRQLVNKGLEKRKKTEMMDEYLEEKRLEEEAKAEDKARKAMRIKKFKVHRRDKK